MLNLLNLRLPNFIDNKIICFKIDLIAFYSIINELVKFLQPLENEKANKFYFKQDRNVFIITRAILRLILSYYLKSTPLEINIHYGQYGKPFLRTVKRIYFSVTHSERYAIIAMAYSIVGVDIEYIVKRGDNKAIVDRWFSESEKLAYRKTADLQKKMLFYHFWCCKEALLKAQGSGLTQLRKIDIANFVVNPTISTISNKIIKNNRWLINTTILNCEYIYALAWRGDQKNIKWFDISLTGVSH